jgi:hypothetical protein
MKRLRLKSNPGNVTPFGKPPPLSSVVLSEYGCASKLLRDMKSVPTRSEVYGGKMQHSWEWAFLGFCLLSAAFVLAAGMLALTEADREMK